MSIQMDPTYAAALDLSDEQTMTDQLLAEMLEVRAWCRDAEDVLAAMPEDDPRHQRALRRWAGRVTHYERLVIELARRGIPEPDL